MTNQEARLQELEERIELVGAYFLATGASMREIAKYFSTHFFPISAKTVNLYVHKYQKKHPELASQLQEKLIQNSEKDYTSLEVQKEILLELDLLFHGYKLEEIALIFEKGSSSVQRDLTKRLEKLSQVDEIYREFYEGVLRKLRENQIETIEVNRKKWK